MIALHWTDSISISRRVSLVTVVDALLDWIGRDRERLQLAALDDRALADFGANRCSVDKVVGRQ